MDDIIDFLEYIINGCIRGICELWDYISGTITTCRDTIISRYTSNEKEKVEDDSPFDAENSLELSGTISQLQKIYPHRPIVCLPGIRFYLKVFAKKEAVGDSLISTYHIGYRNADNEFVEVPIFRSTSYASRLSFHSFTTAENAKHYIQTYLPYPTQGYVILPSFSYNPYALGEVDMNSAFGFSLKGIEYSDSYSYLARRKALLENPSVGTYTEV